MPDNHHDEENNHEASEQSPLVLPVKHSDEFEPRDGEQHHASGSAYMHHDYHDHQTQHQHGHDHETMDQSSKSTLYLILLTLSIGG